jgi:2-methylcitrate dehydratase PrpD
MTDPETRLAAFVATLADEDVPEAVRDRAGLVVADTIGAILGGSSDTAVDALAARWTGDSGPSTVLGTVGGKTTPMRAAFLNGTAGTALELDEGHRFAGGHPAIHVLPALLAEAEADFGTGNEFVTALLAGYEVAARVGRACRPLADGYHPHGVWGAVGAAAAVARYRNEDAATVQTAMRIAANYAQHTRFDAATDGATVRNGFAGMSNLAGIVAADQAAADFTGLADGVARHLAPATDQGLTTAAFVDDLGSRWEVTDGYFKRHAACRFTHPVIDALLDLLADGLAASDVSTVTVETYPAAAELDESRPRNPLQAKFSIPFAVATVLVRGHAGKDAFAVDAIDDQTLALATRVDVTVEPDLAARAPETRGARVTLELTDGTRLEREVPAARGGAQDPFSSNELRAKFDDLATPVVGSERANKLWEAAREPTAPRVLCALSRA